MGTWICWETKKRFVLVGDVYCGKTALAVRLSHDIFLGCDYIPTDFDNFTADVYTKHGRCHLTILDTSGECDENDFSVRSMAYDGCDGVIVCFDLTDRDTLDSVESKWLPELSKRCPGVPFYIVGCKRDAMCEGTEGCVCGANCCVQTEKEVMELIERTGTVAYIECSARSSENVVTLFKVASETVTACKKTSAKKLVASLKKKAKAFRKLSKPSRI